ncbi:UNVERIFIED_CONTAM: putative transcriptional regulator [Acetivibrio alkalicellulosi]
MEKLKLFDAEFKFVSIIWDIEPVNSTELSKICLQKLGWKKPTTYNMIRKLVERGILENRNAMVTAIVKREDVQKFESEALLEKAFDNSLPSFLASFLEGKKLSEKEAQKIKKMIEEATK